MRYSQPEKMEVIRTVEESELSVRRTLTELDIPCSTFYNWYRNYLDRGYDGLTDRKIGPRRFWNRVPDCERERVVQIALDKPELTARELAWHITDTREYYISESSVYRILKSYDLIASPNYILLSARDSFKNPTRRINELWQMILLISRSWAGAGTISAQLWMTIPVTSCPGNSSPACQLVT